jgi:hypothetical protein
MGSLGKSVGVSRADARICIVGAGASGLAAAQALQRRGYRRLTVFERQQRVGGKCHTIVHDGRSYELGAAVVSFAYRNVRSLLAEAGLRASLLVSQSFVDLERGLESSLPLPQPRDWLSLGPQGVRFLRALWRHRRVRQPGFADLDPELSMPFEAWCSAHHVEQIGEMIKPWITGFGYGFLNEVPTAYILKYLTLFGSPMFEIREQGYGGLWQRVARTLAGVDIRLGTSIERIERDDGRVRIHTEGETLDFDALVLACPLDAVLGSLDATPTEKSLFSRIRYYDYYVVGASAEGLPRARCIFFPRYSTPEHLGAPMFAYQRWADRGLTFFYGFAGSRDYAAPARDAVCTAVDRLGGSVREMPVATCWRYFPHVSPEDMAAGFHTQLEGLQGQRSTYYCGEVLAFASVETVVGYARAMVDRHFLPQ